LKNVVCVLAVTRAHTLRAQLCAKCLIFERKLYLTLKDGDAFIWSKRKSQNRDLFEMPTPKLPFTPRPRG
jgi:hypothetical protein